MTDKNSPDPRFKKAAQKLDDILLDSIRGSKSTEAKRITCEACGDSFHPGNIGYHRQYEAQGNLDKHNDTNSTQPTADALVELYQEWRASPKSLRGPADFNNFVLYLVERTEHTDGFTAENVAGWDKHIKEEK